MFLKQRKNLTIWWSRIDLLRFPDRDREGWSWQFPKEYWLSWCFFNRSNHLLDLLGNSKWHGYVMGWCDDQNIENSQLQQTTCNYEDIEIHRNSHFLVGFSRSRNDGLLSWVRLRIWEKFSIWKFSTPKKKKQKLQSVDGTRKPGFGGRKPGFFRDIPGPQHPVTFRSYFSTNVFRRNYEGLQEKSHCSDKF